MCWQVRLELLWPILHGITMMLTAIKTRLCKPSSMYSVTQPCKLLKLDHSSRVSKHSLHRTMEPHSRYCTWRRASTSMQSWNNPTDNMLEASVWIFTLTHRRMYVLYRASTLENLMEWSSGSVATLARTLVWKVLKQRVENSKDSDYWELHLSQISTYQEAVIRIRAMFWTVRIWTS